MTSTPQSGIASATKPVGVTPTPSLGLERTPCSQYGVLAIRSPSLDRSCPTGLIDILQYTEVSIYATDIFDLFVSSIPWWKQYLDWSNNLYSKFIFEKCIFLLQSLKQKLSTYKAQQEEIDERLKCLEAEQEQAEQELITLQGNYYLGFMIGSFPEVWYL